MGLLDRIVHLQKRGHTDDISIVDGFQLNPTQSPLVYSKSRALVFI